MADRDVMLAFPHPGTVRGEFMTRVVTAVHDEHSRIGELGDLMTGPGIGLARNQLASRFLESSMEWLWMVDTDMVISTRTLPALLECADPDERPVVGALCCIYHENQVKATIYSAARADDGTFGFKHVKEWPHDTLLRVDATGCACILMHRSMFARLSDAKPEEEGLWFTEMVIDKHQLGEDLSFCMRCAMAEIPLYVHTGIEVGHMKTVQLGNVRP